MPLDKLLISGADQDHAAAHTRTLETEQAVLIGFGGVHLEVVVPVDAAKDLDVGAGHRFAAAGLQDKAFHAALAPARAQDQGQIAHPDVREGHRVVLLAECGIGTGQQEIKTGLEILGRRQVLDAFLIILGGRQGSRPFPIRLLGQQSFAFVVVEPFRPIASLDSFGPVLAHQAEVDTSEIAVVHLDDRPGLVPDPFRGDLKRPGLDLLHQVEALPSAHAVGKTVVALECQVVGFHQIALLLEDRGPEEAGPGRDFMAAAALDEALQRGLVTGVLLFANGLVGAEL